MAGAIVKQKSFKERITERIRDSIGELMTDDELSEIVTRATEEIFFKPVLVRDRYGSNKEYEAPFVHQLLKELLRPQVKEVVEKYIDEHKADVLKQVLVVVENGIGQALINALSRKFYGDMSALENNIKEKIENEW